MLNFLPRVFYKGGSSSGGGRKYSLEDYNEVKSQWDTMRQLVETEGMGSEIDPIVDEMAQMIQSLEDINGGPLGDDVISYHYLQNSTLQKFFSGYEATAGNDSHFQNVFSPLGLSTVRMDRQGFMAFHKWMTANGHKMNGQYEYARDQLANMRTVMYRDEKGNIRWRRFTDYKSNKHLEMDMRGNGYRVIKTWKGNKTDKELDEYAFMNRKRY